MLVFHSEHSNCWICEVTSHFVMSAGIRVHLTHLFDQNIMMKYKLISAHNNTSDALYYDMHVTGVKCSKKIIFLLLDTECMFM